MSQKKLAAYTIIILIISIIIVLSIPRLPEGDNSRLLPEEEQERNGEHNPFEESNSESKEQEENSVEETIDIRIIE
ncbi:MAG: hypothetical protein ACOC2J_02845 [bacterium]